MKKLLSLFIFLSLGFGLIFSQIPMAFRYQAVIRDASGNIRANTLVSLKVEILQGSINGSLVFTETYTDTTNAFGMVTLAIGSVNTVDFGNINWSVGPYYLKLLVDGVEMGTSQILSVPYALYSLKAGNGFSGNYNDLANLPGLFSGNYADLSGKPSLFDGTWTSLSGKPILFSGNYNDLSNKPALFSGNYNDLLGKPVPWDSSWLSIKNKPYLFNGQFGSLAGVPTSLYGYGITDGVNTTGDQTIGGNKRFSGNIKSKFAIEGSSELPSDTALFEVKDKNGNVVFAVYEDGAVLIVNKGAKGSRGGFTVGGRSNAKGSAIEEIMRVTPDSVRIYIDSSSVKGARSGFAVGGRNPSKGSPFNEYFSVTPDSTRIYIDDSQAKGSRGGFAVGGRNPAKGVQRDYMRITQDKTNIYVRSLTDNSSSTFNILGIDKNLKQTSLLKASKDTIEVDGLLNVQNNMIVKGNINVAGNIKNDTSKIKDIDGNIYDTIKIGKQVWMKQNLATTRYNNGDTIPNVHNNTTWIGLSTGAYCFYSDSVKYKDPYGALYNWYAVNDPRKLCPAGWHVPSDAEWTLLTDSSYLGGLSAAGSALKEAGTTHWHSPNIATNTSRFTGLPGGFRSSLGAFQYLGLGGAWWSLTGYSTGTAWDRYLRNNNMDVVREFSSKLEGCSVRCLKD